MFRCPMSGQNFQVAFIAALGYNVSLYENGSGHE